MVRFITYDSPRKEKLPSALIGVLIFVVMMAIYLIFLQEAHAHPNTISADLLENGIPVTDVKFIGIERVGNIGIIELVIEFFQSIVM